MLFLKDEITDDKVGRMKERFMSAYDTTADGRLQIQEVRLLVFPQTFICLYSAFSINYT